MGDVLVVDDDEDLRDVVVLALHSEGYVVRSAPHGASALERVEEGRPALILLDILMPVMDGPTFARELRARHEEVPPIVVMTAAENPAARAREIGAHDVLSKPFDIRELLRVVGHWCRECVSSDAQCRA